ncbi:MAG: GLPGLI family protein [Bacteroidota bacterium]
MKNLKLPLLFLFLPLITFGQTTEGTIRYLESIKIEVELPEGHEHLKDLIPTSNDREKVLHFTPTESMYQDENKADDTQDIAQNTGDMNVQVKVVSGSSEDKLYKNETTNQWIDQRDFMGKLFLIKGAVEPYQWKITQEQQSILGYQCQKAVYRQADAEIIAWFTPQIPVPNGPDRYGQLPGMILAVSAGAGKQTITATHIDLATIDRNVLTPPKKGKKVTRSEFQKIQEKKLAEMGANEGGTTTVIRMDVDDRGR